MVMAVRRGGLVEINFFKRFKRVIEVFVLGVGIADFYTDVVNFGKVLADEIVKFLGQGVGVFAILAFLAEPAEAVFIGADDVLDLGAEVVELAMELVGIKCVLLVDLFELLKQGRVFGEHILIRLLKASHRKRIADGSLF